MTAVGINVQLACTKARGGDSAFLAASRYLTLQLCDVSKERSVVSIVSIIELPKAAIVWASLRVSQVLLILL